MPDAQLTKEQTLAQLQQQLKAWDGCALAKNANPVPGEGNPHSKVVFIGEAPGRKEDELGRPFMGAAGKFLSELIESIGQNREDVYITNIVKYRPPDNRDPTPAEKEQCTPWLLRELEIIRPKIIVPMGKHSLGYFFPNLKISEVHGTPVLFRGGRICFPLYHPAAALHNGGLRQVLKDDFCKLKGYLEKM